jgi:hypothetical protein
MWEPLHLTTLWASTASWGIALRFRVGEVMVEENYNVVFRNKFQRVLTILYNSRNYWVLDSLHSSVQWLRLALCKGPNRVGVSPLIRGPKQIHFPKPFFFIFFIFLFYLFFNTGRWAKSRNPAIPSIFPPFMWWYEFKCECSKWLVMEFLVKCVNIM